MSYILDEKENVDNSEGEAVESPEARSAQRTKDKRTNPEPPSDLAERISELEDALRLEKNRADDLLRRLQYLQADFENYRKRVDKEIGDAKRYGNERLLSDLLTVKDELELAYTKAQESNQNPVILDGVGMILKRLQGLLSKEGVERVPGVGSKFNPEYHEAALRVPSDDEDGTVVEEVRPGYLLKGKVLRASIVKVAEKRPVEQTEGQEESKE